MSPLGLSFELNSSKRWRERERVVLCEFYGPHKRTNELVGMKRNYQHLLSSKKWMLAFSIDRKCINRDVRRGWKKIYSIFFLIILFILSSLLLMMKKEDFVVRKIKRKEEILECVDGWTKLTFFKRERELCECVYERNSCGGGSCNKCIQTMMNEIPTIFLWYFDIKISIKNKSHPFEYDRLQKERDHSGRSSYKDYPSSFL